MVRAAAVIGRAALALCAAVCIGCQARHMVDTYNSFDTLITDLYESHVLLNLARRDNGRTMVQIDFRNFSANLSYNTSMSGKVSFFANPSVGGAGDSTVSLQTFRQSFEPNMNSSVGTGLGVASAPAERQDEIRALYDEQVARKGVESFFHRTDSMLVALRSYRWIRTPEGEIYYVPQYKHREFADFVHRVCFFKPPPASAPAMPAASPPAPAAPVEPPPAPVEPPPTPAEPPPTQGPPTSPATRAPEASYAARPPERFS